MMYFVDKLGANAAPECASPNHNSVDFPLSVGRRALASTRLHFLRINFSSASAARAAAIRAARNDSRNIVMVLN